MQKRKLNYRIHDPNPVAVSANYILAILIEANTQKAEAAIREEASAGHRPEYGEFNEGHPA